MLIFSKGFNFFQGFFSVFKMKLIRTNENKRKQR